MRAVVQRVRHAAVTVEEAVCARVGPGLLVLLGVENADTPDDAQRMAQKIVRLRIFPDDAGLMNRDVLQSRGSVLLVSQFTLLGDARKGRRPSFAAAAVEERARPLYELTGSLIEREGLAVAYGVFGAHMQVDLRNDGPVTILLDTKKRF